MPHDDSMFHCALKKMESYHITSQIRGFAYTGYGPPFEGFLFSREPCTMGSAHLSYYQAFRFRQIRPLMR